MTLSDSQKKVLKKALRQTLREWRSQQVAAEKWGDPAPSIYDVRILELTPKKAQIFLRHGLFERRGSDPSHDQRVATSAFGRSYSSKRVEGAGRFFWTREGLVTVKRLLEAKKPRGNPVFLSDSQKKVFRRAVRRTLRERNKQAAAARSRGESEPSIYDMPVTGLTSAYMEVFKRHGLIGDQGRWNRKGLEYALDLLQAKNLKKKLGITGEVPLTSGEINALPVGTFLLKHGESLHNFVPAEKPIGFLRVDNTEKGWIVGVLGSGVAFRGPVDPLGILEVVPLTPAILASMVDVQQREAWIPLPRSAGYGKADQKAWAYWLGAEILDAGSEARQALKDAIESRVGSEVKIGDITWNPGQEVRVEFAKVGEKPQSMGFLMNRSNPVSYKVEVRKNGQRYGEFGPYKRKSDADADAKALRQKGPDVQVSVVSNPGHQWIQEVQEEIEEDGTAGRFTAQARRAGYDSPMAFAQKIMHEWRAGRERVWNKREKRWQKVTTMTMRRANYLLNIRQRRNG